MLFFDSYNMLSFGPTGEYHQYDMCAYPKVTTVPKGFFGQVKAKVSSFFRYFQREQQSDDGKEDFKPPSKEDLASQCLHFYLEPYRNEILQEEKSLVVDSATEIAHIYFKICRPYINRSDMYIPELTMIVSTTYYIHTCKYIACV